MPSTINVPRHAACTDSAPAESRRKKRAISSFIFTAIAAGAVTCTGAAAPEPFDAGGSWGYRDEAGLTLIAPVYSSAGSFSEGVAEVRLPNGEWAIIDRTGSEIQRSSSPVLGVLSDGLSVFVMNGKFGYKDARGREMVPASLSGAGLFSERLAPARKDKWGFIHKSGKFAIPAIYESVRGFSGGLAAFRMDGRWGYLSKNGRRAVKNIFFEAGDFSEGLAAVKLNSLWGYIDDGGRLGLAPVYAFAGPFSGGLAAVSMPSGDADQSAHQTGETRWIDREGATIYRGLRPAGDGLEIIVSSSGGYGFAKDRTLAIPAMFEDAAGCWSGLCLVKKGGRQVFIDHYGKTVLDTEFEDAAPLGCGLYRAGLQQKYGVLGSTGAVIARPLYDSIEGSGCNAGLAAILQGAAGRLDSLSGEFFAGLSAQDPPPVKPGEKCLGIEKSFATMKYSEIPEYCGAQELRTLLGTYPDCLNCLLAIAHIHTASDGQGPADKKAALEALAQAIPLSEEPAWLHQWRINLLSPATTQAAAAMLLEDYHRLIRLEPYKPEHYRAICRAYGLLKEPPEDIRSSSYYCDLAVKMDTETSENLFSRANFRRLAGDAAGALEDLTTLTGLSPKNKEVRLARARLSGEIGQDFRAVFDCSAVLEETPEDADALEERAMAYIRMGSCDKALADLESAGKIRPGAGNLHKMAVYRWLCEKNVAGTLAIVRDLSKPTEQCGGSCWRPGDYEQYLGDLYGTGTYAELLKPQPPEAPPAPEQE